MQPGVKVNGAYYCDVLLLKQLLRYICQAAGDFYFPVHHTYRRSPSYCDKTVELTPNMQPPNRPDLNPVDYRIWTVIKECIYQKQQVDVINRIAYYISQGRVETPIRRGGQFCCSFVANLLQYLCAKNYQNTMQFDKVIAKIQECNFLPHSVYALRRVAAINEVQDPAACKRPARKHLLAVNQKANVAILKLSITAMLRIILKHKSVIFSK